MIQFKGYFLFSLRIWSVVSSSWVTNGLWWLLTLVLYLDLCISYLTVGILRSRWIVSLVHTRMHLIGILAFSIGSVGVFQCWNYLLFPIVGLRWTPDRFYYGLIERNFVLRSIIREIILSVSRNTPKNFYY